MATAQRQEPKATPAPILEETFGFAATQILATAIDLELFTHLAKGVNTVEALARATACSPHGDGLALPAARPSSLPSTSHSHTSASQRGYDVRVQFQPALA
jgi:hypothetical protein